MANSISFNSVDLATYGFRVLNFDDVFAQLTDSEQLLDRGYGFSSRRPARPINFDVSVVAANLATLLSNIDSIKLALNQRSDCTLAIDGISDRYWMVRYESWLGKIIGGKVWRGTVSFVAYDPAAYGNTLVTTVYTGATIITHPDTITETVLLSTEKTFPIYTFDSDVVDATAVIKLENEATGEIIEWSGVLAIGSILVINTQTCIVTLDAAEDMLTVDGEFPSLLPGANILNIDGFEGHLSISYRARYI